MLNRIIKFCSRCKPLFNAEEKIFLKHFRSRCKQLSPLGKLISPSPSHRKSELAELVQPFLSNPSLNIALSCPSVRHSSFLILSKLSCRYIDFSKSLHGFVKVATWICQSCLMYFSPFGKQNHGQLTEWTLAANSELQLVKISTLPTGEHHVLLIWKRSIEKPSRRGI